MGCEDLVYSIQQLDPVEQVSLGRACVGVGGWVSMSVRWDETQYGWYGWWYVQGVGWEASNWVVLVVKVGVLGFPAGFRPGMLAG